MRLPKKEWEKERPEENDAWTGWVSGIKKLLIKANRGAEISGKNTGILPLNLQKTNGKFTNSDHGFIVIRYRKVVTFVDLNN
ncbi:hypothetical protein [Larkinella punicea]|uniref:hypothetical protein n=1 Tax=Larkinella punicea TaxID=2315727 RepID=UPI001401DDFA|nr:hypothetical protein [Larkinella punicea]